MHSRKKIAAQIGQHRFEGAIKGDALRSLWRISREAVDCNMLTLV